MLKRMLLLNGLAIIGIVLSHSIKWANTAMFWWTDQYRPVAVPNYDQMNTASYFAMVVLQKVGVFAVPAFLFISGFFVAYAARGKSTLTWKMVGVRLKNLLIPYLIWSIIIFVVDFFQGTTYPPVEYLRRLLLCDAVPAYYYVFLLCQLYILSPLLAPFAKARSHLLLSISLIIFVAIVSLFYVKLYSELAGIEMPFIDRLLALVPGRSFLRFIFFFVMGMVSGFHLQRFKQWLQRFKWHLLTIAIVSAPLAIIETELIFQLTGMDWRGGIFTLTGALYAISFILAFMAFDRVTIPFSKTIYELGLASFGIYLLHTTALEFFARVIRKLTPWLLAYQGVFMCVVTALAVAGPFLFMKLVSKSPLRKYHRYLFG
jgi:peptidoglycan/LPS O-acetylase OafA/YrhL